MRASLDHVAMNAREPMKLVRFYAEVLGLEPLRVAEFQTGEVPFPSVRLNEDSILDFFPEALWPDELAPGEENEKGTGTLQERFPLCARIRQNHICLAVSTPEFEQLLERLERRGVPIHEGPVPRWGAHGTGISVYFHDPEGNMIEVRHYPEQG